MSDLTSPISRVKTLPRTSLMCYQGVWLLGMASYDKTSYDMMTYGPFFQILFFSISVYVMTSG